MNVFILVSIVNNLEYTNDYEIEGVFKNKYDAQCVMKELFDKSYLQVTDSLYDGDMPDYLMLKDNDESLELLIFEKEVV